MHLSKFEKQHFAQFRHIVFDENGKIHLRPQRSKIPRTKQVKRLYEKTGKLVPMKKWAREADETIVADWRKAK